MRLTLDAPTAFAKAISVAGVFTEDAYRYKLLPVPGAYILDGPLQLVDGIGHAAAGELAALGLSTIRGLIEAKGLPSAYRKLQHAAMRHSAKPEFQLE